MSVLRNPIKGIDWLVEWSARILGWLVIIIMLTVTFEVIMRFVFNSPTAWSYDITYMMGGVFFLFTVPYVHLRNEQIRISFFFDRFSPRTQKIVDVVATFVFLFGALLIFTQQSWILAFRALATGEVSRYGFWEPTVVPFRFALAVGFSLLLLSAISKVISDLFYAVNKVELLGTTKGAGK